jgi:hypothetical protein
MENYSLMAPFNTKQLMKDSGFLLTVITMVIRSIIKRATNQKPGASVSMSKV